jgi:hypothetical protein
VEACDFDPLIPNHFERLRRKFFVRRNFPSLRADALATTGSAKAFTTAALSLAMTCFGTPLERKAPPKPKKPHFAKLYDIQMMC